MKKLNYILIWVTCMVLLSLTSCIKEESYTRHRLSMDVTVTRGGSTSDQQGDKIEEIMVWAFRKSSSTTVENRASGWRKAVYSAATYASASVHLELPMCGDAGADYILIAVLNPAKFGKVTYNGSEITLGAETTYTELINARFANSSAATPILSAVAEGLPGDPALMPVSHWTTVTVEPSDLHTSLSHKVAKMTVFRAVAKTQFLMARTSDFDLKVLSLKLHNQKMPVDGMVLSQLSKPQLETVNVSPSWFGSNTPAEATTDAQKLHDFEILSGGVAVTKTLTTTSNNMADYSAVGACTIAETLDACTYSDNAKSVPADAADGGYYYEITYQIGSDTPQTRYVALPAITRNHDYQVRALVNGEGGLNVNYHVADWEDVVWTMDFSPANNTNLLAAPNVAAVATQSPKIIYNANVDLGTPFKGYFRMSSPVGVMWKPTFYDAEADDYDIEIYEVLDPTTTPVTLSATPVLTNGVAGDGDETYMKVTDANKETFFEVRVIAKDAARNNKKFKFAIAHRSPWHTDSKLLLINAGASSTSTYWPESGNHHTYIEILQN